MTATAATPAWEGLTVDAVLSCYDAYCAGDAQLFTLQSPLGLDASFIWDDDTIAKGPSTSCSDGNNSEQSCDTRNHEPSLRASSSVDMPAAVPCDAAAHSDSDGSHCDAEASACPSNTNRRGQKGGIVKRKGAKRAGTAAKGRGAAAAAAKKPKAETCLLGVLQPFTIVKPYSASSLQELNRKIQQLEALA